MLESIATDAGLKAAQRFETSWPFVYADVETMVEKTLAPGIVVAAIRHGGEGKVRQAIADALSPFGARDGRVVLHNEWHCLVARAS